MHKLTALRLSAAGAHTVRRNVLTNPLVAAQPAVAADRFAREIVWFSMYVFAARLRQLNGNPLAA
jgi:hypothetical protein